MILAMTIICILYGLFGFVGYLRYGADCKGTITLNVPSTEMYGKFHLNFVFLFETHTQFWPILELRNASKAFLH